MDSTPVQRNISSASISSLFNEHMQSKSSMEAHTLAGSVFNPCTDEVLEKIVRNGSVWISEWQEYGGFI